MWQDAGTAAHGAHAPLSRHCKPLAEPCTEPTRLSHGIAGWRHTHDFDYSVVVAGDDEATLAANAPLNEVRMDGTIGWWTQSRI